MQVSFFSYKNQNFTYTLYCKVLFKDQSAISYYVMTEAFLYDAHQNALLMVAESLLKDCLMNLEIKPDTKEFVEAFYKAKAAFDELNDALQSAGTVFSGVGTFNSSQFSYQNEGSINGVGVSRIAKAMPGVNQKVEYPCLHKISGYKSSLESVIIHLNDACHWSREQIAHWLDKLHDSGEINIEFGSEPIKPKRSKMEIYELSLVEKEQAPHPTWEVNLTEDEK